MSNYSRELNDAKLVAGLRDEQLQRHGSSQFVLVPNSCAAAKRFVRERDLIPESSGRRFPQFLFFFLFFFFRLACHPDARGSAYRNIQQQDL
jgi:hypothetical protein